MSKKNIIKCLVRSQELFNKLFKPSIEDLIKSNREEETRYKKPVYYNRQEYR